MRALQHAQQRIAGVPNRVTGERARQARVHPQPPLSPMQMDAWVQRWPLKAQGTHLMRPAGLLARRPLGSATLPSAARHTHTTETHTRWACVRHVAFVAHAPSKFHPLAPAMDGLLKLAKCRVAADVGTFAAPKPFCAMQVTGTRGVTALAGRHAVKGMGSAVALSIVAIATLVGGFCEVGDAVCQG